MAAIQPFSTPPLPRINFGPGTIGSLAEEVANFGANALIVTGKASFAESPRWDALTRELKQAGVSFEHLAVANEPSPELVDDAVKTFKGKDVDVVVGLGGGSALDAAKAIAGLLVPGNSVLDHLEGAGPENPYAGPAIPFIAVPTTAGTGSEATKNAVLSRHGADGYKKSFRDDALVARVAIVDPDLLETCPANVIAANGMDAFTQLLESYVSIRANPLSRALAQSGLESFVSGFFAAWEGEGEQAVEGRSNLAYASLISGICLAQTGLGSVHGLASPLGAFFPIPHGVACGTLVAEATDINIHAILDREPGNPALKAYAGVAALITGEGAIVDETSSEDPAFFQALDALVRTLRQWTERLGLPRLGAYGVDERQIGRIVAASRGSSMKTNPIRLSDSEIAELIERRL